MGSLRSGIMGFYAAGIFKLNCSVAAGWRKANYRMFLPGLSQGIVQGVAVPRLLLCGDVFLLPLLKSF
jgi:hypothetical protein